MEITERKQDKCHLVHVGLERDLENYECTLYPSATFREINKYNNVVGLRVTEEVNER